MAVSVVTTCKKCGEISRIPVPPKAKEEDYPYFLLAAELVENALHHEGDGCAAELEYELGEGVSLGVVRLYDNALERRNWEDDYSDYG